MGLIRKTKIAAIPDVAGIADPAVRRILQAMKENIDVYRGTAPNAEILDTAITKRELYEAGLIDVIRDGRRIRFGGQNNSSIVPNTPLPNLAIPPAPENLQTAGGLSVILLTWDAAAYGNHAYTEIWRAAVDDLGAATRIGSVTGFASMYADTVGGSATYYYWIRFVSDADRAGPYNDTAGTIGQTGNDPAYLLSILTEQITASQLHASLSAPIATIPSIQSTLGGLVIDIAAIETILADLEGTPEFDEDADEYLIGNIVKYDGGLYRAIADMLTPPHPLPTDTDYWEKIGDYASLGDAVAAHSALISDLETRVDVAEGTISANSSAITALGSGLTDAENAITANASAISGLDTRVTSAEGTITSQSGAITALQSDLTDLNGDVSANAGAISALQTTVSNQGDAIVANALSITQIEARIIAAEEGPSRHIWPFDENADGWTPSSATFVWQSGGTMLWTPTGGNPYIQRALAAPDRFQGADYTRVRARVRRVSGTGTWEGNLYYSTSGHGANNSFRKQIPVPSNPNLWNILEWDMANLTAGGSDWIDNEILNIRIDLVSDATSAWEFDWIIVSQAAVTATASAINSIQTTVTQQGNDITANASAISGLSATVGSNTAAISVNASAIASLEGEVYAEYTIKVQTLGGNPVIAGIGLIAEPGGSTIGLIADRIYFAHPSSGANISPFVYDGGVVYIQNASIVNLTSSNIQAGAIAGDRITAGTTLSAPVIVGGSVQNTASDPTNYVNLNASGGTTFIRAASGVDVKANGQFVLGNPSGANISFNGTVLTVARMQTAASGARFAINPEGQANSAIWYSGGTTIRVAIGTEAHDIPGFGTTDFYGAYGHTPTSINGLLGRTTSGAGLVGVATTGTGVRAVAGISGVPLTIAGGGNLPSAGDGAFAVGASTSWSLRFRESSLWKYVVMMRPTTPLTGTQSVAGGSTFTLPIGVWHINLITGPGLRLEVTINGTWQDISNHNTWMNQVVSNGSNARVRNTGGGATSFAYSIY